MKPRGWKVRVVERKGEQEAFFMIPVGEVAPGRAPKTWNMEIVESGGEKGVYYMAPIHEAMTSADLQRKRGLIGRLTSLFRPKYANVTSDADDEGSTDMAPIGGAALMFGGSGGSQTASAYYAYTKLEQTRKARYADYEQMDQESIETSVALDVTVANIYTSNEGDEDSYKIQAEGEVERVLKEMDDRVSMAEYSRAVCRDALLHGDNFTEIVVDENRAVMRLKPLPARLMRRQEDEFGRLHAERAFALADDDGVARVEFPHWAVVHLRMHHRLGDMYGTSQFAAARRPWRQLHLMEDGIVLNRLTRASKRYAYLIDVPKPTGAMDNAEWAKIVAQAKTQLRRRSIVDSEGRLDLRKAPLIPEDDVFLPVYPESRGDVRVFDSGDVSGNLEDVRYFRDKQITAGRVPKAYLGLEGDSRSRATMTWQDIEYARLCRSEQKTMASWHREIYDRQLHLAGIGFDKDSYKIVFPPISFVDEQLRAQVEMLKWQIAQTMKQTFGIPTEWILRHVIRLSDEDTKEILAGIREPEQQQPSGFGGIPWGGEQVASRIREQRHMAELRDMITAIRRERLMRPVEV